MILYYVICGNYDPEEFVAGYFKTEEDAQKACDYLNGNSDCSMHNVASMNTSSYYNSFEEWKEKEEK